MFETKNWNVKIGIRIPYQIFIFVFLVDWKLKFDILFPISIVLEIENWKSKLHFRFSYSKKNGWHSSTCILHLHLEMQMPDLCSKNIVVFSSLQPLHTS